MADTLVKKPKLIVGTQAQVSAEMGANDIGFATDIEFYTSKQIDELLSKAGGASLPILMAMWSDHILDDISWLRADTFSWQSGDTYKVAYEHLVADYENTAGGILYAWNTGVGSYVYTLSESPSVGDSVYDSTGGLYSSDYITEVADGGIYVGENVKTSELHTRDSSRDTKIPQTDTIGNITITYYLAQDGHKICLPDQESNITAAYEKTGAADYYILDMTNKRFKLPRKQKRTLIQAVKNDDGTWYNLYSDGWVEQGCHEVAPGTSWTLPVPMANDAYTLVASYIDSSSTSTSQWQHMGIQQYSTYITTKANGIAQRIYISGMAAESAYASAGMRLEYYYVGNFEQSATEQTAGLNAELFNNKADRDLGNIPANYDYVVESQMPTAANNYTWYRKYKSGWVEQGGSFGEAYNSYTTKTITLPIEMTDTKYSVCLTNASTGDSYAPIINSKTVTTFVAYRTTNYQGLGTWQVSGMSAQ